MALAIGHGRPSVDTPIPAVGDPSPTAAVGPPDVHRMAQRWGADLQDRGGGGFHRGRGGGWGWGGVGAVGGPPPPAQGTLSC